MGYTHGKEWNFKKIEYEVKKVMESLGIKRMPSRSEIYKLQESYSLVTAIGRNGGFLNIANKMNIPTKGRNKSYKWSDKKVEEEIKKVMGALGIKRMPSRSEVKLVETDLALSNKIAKTYGYYGWAEKLNLDIKESETQKAVDAEKEVAKMIKENTNLNSKQTSMKAPYDILVDSRVKVEVKYSDGYKNAFYSANLYDGLQKADILVFICRNEELGNKNLIIPSHHLQKKTQLSVGKKSQYDKFNNRWDYITKFNEFMKTF